MSVALDLTLAAWAALELAVRAEPVRIYDVTRPVASFSWWITSRGPDSATGFVTEVRLGAGLTYRHAFGDSPLAACSYEERSATVRCLPWGWTLPPASTLGP